MLFPCLILRTDVCLHGLDRFPQLAFLKQFLQLTRESPVTLFT